MSSDDTSDALDLDIDIVDGGPIFSPVRDFAGEGHILAERGMASSRRLKGYPPPFHLS